MPVTERASRHDREPRPCAVHGLIHLARHTFATEHREVAGIDAASQPLGHADLLSTIRVYKDRDQTDLETAMDRPQDHDRLDPSAGATQARRSR
jgi:integrase